jgi:hypothetical protein
MSEPDLLTKYKGFDSTDSQGRKKKSRIIPPERRKKVAQACDMCKKRKQKCNGLQPCPVCQEKGFECGYTAIDRRVLKPTRKELEEREMPSGTGKAVRPMRTDNPFSDTQHTARIPASLQPLLSFPLSLTDTQDDAMVSLGNDQNWRLLFDEGGNLRFLGESCGLSYLLQCRKLFSKVLGPQGFSDDPKRLLYHDNPGILPNAAARPLPPREYADYLVNTFLNNLNNILYIFDDSELLQLLNRVYFASQPREVCVLTLVLAIGSVFAKVEIPMKLFPFPQSMFIQPDALYQSAMAIMGGIMDDGNLWLVEVHLLVFFYHHFSGLKHSAWVKLGAAIRYALGLGLNRKYVNESFKEPNVVLHRRRIFRSLFIMDTLSAVHLGRSMTIREQDWDDMKSLDYLDDYQNKLVQVCQLSSMVLNCIYFNPSVTIRGALKLAVEMKLYSLKHPIKPVSIENYPAPVDHKFLLPHVIYLHSIILLSRPFFHFIVLKKLGLVKYSPDPKRLKHLHSFYHSCIKASLLIVKIVEYCYYQNIHPFRPMSLVSCTFHAGMVMGLLLLLRHRNIDPEMFKDDPNVDVDPEAMLSSAMSSIIKVLIDCGHVDAQSKSYSVILQNMFDATLQKPDLDVNPKGNTQESFENILRFQDWLFPRVDSLPGGSSEISTTSGFEMGESTGNSDEFLKELAGLSNVDPSCQFLDDLLYNVIDTSREPQKSHE